MGSTRDRERDPVWKRLGINIKKQPTHDIGGTITSREHGGRKLAAAQVKELVGNSKGRSGRETKNSCTVTKGDAP